MYALRTRAPLVSGIATLLPFDLHVLGLPLAFILSQDQTLHCKRVDSLFIKEIQIWLSCLLMLMLYCYSTCDCNLCCFRCYVSFQYFKELFCGRCGWAAHSFRLAVERSISFVSTFLVSKNGAQKYVPVFVFQMFGQLFFSGLVTECRFTTGGGCRVEVFAPFLFTLLMVTAEAGLLGSVNTETWNL